MFNSVEIKGEKQAIGLMREDGLKKEIRRILGGTLLALTTALGSAGCGGNVVTQPENLTQLPFPDAETTDAGSEGDAYLDRDGDANDAKQDCNRVEIVHSDGKSQGGSVPLGSTNIRLLCFDLLTGCETGNLTELHFKEYGANDGAMKVYVAESYPQGARLSEIRSGTDANFTGLKLPVLESNGGDGKFSTYCLFGNLDGKATPGATYSYEMLKPEPSFMTNQPEVLMGSVAGDSFQVTTAMVDGVEAWAEPKGYLASGVQGKIGSITMEQGQMSDGGLQRVSLKLGGSCDRSRIKDLYLIKDASTPSIINHTVGESGMVHFPVYAEPFTLPKGGSATWSLMADQTCNPGENIIVYLDQPSDLYMEDKQFGFGEMVFGNFCGEGPNCQPSVVEITQ